MIAKSNHIITKAYGFLITFTEGKFITFGKAKF